VGGGVFTLTPILQTQKKWRRSAKGRTITSGKLKLVVKLQSNVARAIYEGVVGVALAARQGAGQGRVATEIQHGLVS